MTESMPYLATGLLLGLAAGVMPGPLTALIITETISHNRRQGIVVACVPVLTDLPIIMVSVFILSELEQFKLALGMLAVSGAVYLAFLAYRNISMKSGVSSGSPGTPQSLRKGIIANFLSPNPYLFWMTVGAAAALNAYRVSITSLILFFASFYFCLVGAQISLALLVDRFKSFMTSNAYQYILKAMGLLLLIFSALYLRDGVKLLGLISNS